MYSMIRNTNDLRHAYLDMYIWKHFAPDGAEDRIKEIKSAIRNYYKRQDEETKDRRLVKDYYGDGYILLIDLPDFIHDEESAVSYFKETEYILVFWSQYDCTGRPFTSWYKIFKRRGKWMAYHSVGFDV